MNLTVEQIRDLAQLERDMDAGVQPFVVVGGHRASVQPETLAHFHLVSGQTVSDEMWCGILRWIIEDLQRQLVEQRAQEAVTIGPDFLADQERS